MSTGSHFSYTSCVITTSRNSRNKMTLIMFHTVSYWFSMRGEKSGFCLTSMLSKLWVAQDLFAELQAVSVLLVLVTSLQQKTEQTLHQTSEANSLHSTAALILRQPCKVHEKAIFASVLNVPVVRPASKEWSITNIASLAVQSVRDDSTEMNGGKSTWWNSIDDGGLLMKCNQTGGQMDVPSSEQRPGAQSGQCCQLPLQYMHSGLWQN